MPAPRIVLVGQPNAGKSTLFNVLSDVKSAAGNFAGTSVRLIASDVRLDGREFRLLDLPGTYSLNASDDAERVTRDFLLREPVDLLVNVVDSTQLARSLELTCELRELGLPMAVALNMEDEAEKRGLKIDSAALERALGVPVTPTSALHGKGVRRLMERCLALLAAHEPPPPPAFTARIESQVQRLARLLPEPPPGRNGSRRFYAIKAIENPEMVPEEWRPLLAGELAAAGGQIRDFHGLECYETIACERHHRAMKLSEEASRFAPRRTFHLHDRLDRFLLHPLAGRLLMLTYFLFFFAAIYLLGGLFSRWLEPLLGLVPALLLGLRRTAPALWLTLDGVYQGLAGAVGIVLPYLLPLAFIHALFEESGYLSRVAFLLDGLLHRIGLHGKSAAAFILGFGCTAPALYATRILENRRDRFLSALLLPFVPCSARNAVIFAVCAALAGPLWALAIYAFSLLVIAGVGRALSFFLARPSALVMEIPDLKLPSARNAAAAGLRQIREFVRAVVPLLLLGSAAMSWLGRLDAGAAIDRALSPVVHGVLGLPAALGMPLAFGFFRKELIVVMAQQALGAASLAQLPLTAAQAVVFLVFVTLYFPCLSTFVVLGREFNWRTAAASALLSFAVATASAWLFRAALALF
ncbi:MAG TPA: ferrous iron transport protein B [Candidatus Aminicenantes bacterium]|nr:ferrous iron transport protein B [Candidatus Aminicenantes bacterium]